VDRDATVAAYVRAERGGSDTCTCAWCRNFAAARDKVYPHAFLAFLNSLGVDSRKDGEVCHSAQLAPGQHQYGGWFHFVGSLQKTGDTMVSLGSEFTVWLQRPSAPELDSLKGLPLVQVEFEATAVPWVLSEPELDWDT
jgi:hypothetical protein